MSSASTGRTHGARVINRILISPVSGSHFGLANASFEPIPFPISDELDAAPAAPARVATETARASATTIHALISFDRIVPPERSAPNTLIPT